MEGKKKEKKKSTSKAESRVVIKEKDVSGHVISTYILTTSPSSNPSSTSKLQTRVDRVPLSVLLDASATTLELSSATSLQPHNTSPVLQLKAKAESVVHTHISPLFLPNGYPHTVTADYTPYQIYDSLQAFASTIAGLLSSRAVLQSLGLDTDTSESTTTYATLLSIAQSTISNLSTILFAHHASSRISSEVKYYRFLADIVNDIAFVLDCLSPSLPHRFRLPILCLSSACRAVCGVAGGSSKAVLSAHFAKGGNIGELNAKDGSQETVVNLVGMWVGGLVVSRVRGMTATWMWMLVLLGLHLWFNYCAVRSVKLRGLNSSRAAKVVCEMLRNENDNQNDNRSDNGGSKGNQKHHGHKIGSCPSVQQVGRDEGIFGSQNALLRRNGKVFARARIGARLDDIARCMCEHEQKTTHSRLSDDDLLQKLIEIFSDENYLMWFDNTVIGREEVMVVLKDEATKEDQLKALFHAYRVVCYLAATCPSPTTTTTSKVTKTKILDGIVTGLRTTNDTWMEILRRIQDAGWDVASTTLEIGPSQRLSLFTTPS